MIRISSLTPRGMRAARQSNRRQQRGYYLFVLFVCFCSKPTSMPPLDYCRTVILGQSWFAMTKSKDKAPAHEPIVALFGCKSIRIKDIYTPHRPTVLQCPQCPTELPCGS